MGRPTIRDVAAAAGVSVTTVSDAMSGKGRVDPSTRDAVRSTAERLGWQPRRAAQTLRSGRSGIIALTLPNRHRQDRAWLLNRDYYLTIAASASAAALAHDRLMLLVPGSLTADEIERTDLDGGIVVDPLSNDTTVAAFEQTGRPCVTIDRDLGAESPWWAGTGEAAGIDHLLAHLDDRGAGNIALITADEDWSWFRGVENTYVAWCEQHGRAPFLRYVDLAHSAEQTQLRTRELLDDPTFADGRRVAVVAVPSGSASPVVQAAADAGLDVPESVMIAAAVDGQATVLSSPPITAIDLRPADVAAAAISLLESRLTKSPVEGPAIVDARLIVRESTSPA